MVKLLISTKKGECLYNNIAKYAVNGAIHYAHAILHHAESYDEVIAIGVNGFDTPTERVYEIGVYYVSKKNLFIPIKAGEFSDLSFLLPEHINTFISTIDELSLTDEEIENKKLKLEDDIERNLKAINQKLHDEHDIVVGSRVKIMAGMVMAGLGVPGRVSPLKVEDLRGELGEHTNDSAVIMNRISEYLEAKQLPREKRQIIENELRTVFNNNT